jgi:glycosyltransferase involved in cell wall biosynthesis
MKKFYLIVNEKISNKNKLFFCENKDIQTIINYLTIKFNLFIFSRGNRFASPFKINNTYKILNFRFIKIFYFLYIFFNLDKKKKNILIISISPFNFIMFFIFKIFFDCKFYLYLRSNGYEEYENIIGKKYIWIYDYMFKYITNYCEVISCHKRLYDKKCHILYPSELTLNWEKNTTKNYFTNNVINITYVGRFKIEKGIYSLLNIFSELPENIRLTLVGSGDLIKHTNFRIKIINFVNNENKLIKLYDLSNIIILPSYTEAHPKVIDEALSRMRPVIVFDDIKYVINNRYGVFSVKRDTKELLKIINFIKKNNQFISHGLKKNKLPKKKVFLKNLYNIISAA